MKSLRSILCLSVVALFIGLIGMHPKLASGQEHNGDYNNDGFVDERDLLLLIEAFKNNDNEIDPNNDGILNSEDLIFFSSHWKVSLVNFAPTINAIPEQVIEIGDTLMLSIVAEDPNNDALTFTTKPLPLPPNLQFDSVKRTLSFQPAPNQSGEFRITLTVTDGLLSDSEEIVIRVPEIQADAQTGLIGEVRDTSTGQPLMNVRIAANSVEAFTDETGAFSVLGIETESEVVVLEIDGSQVADGPYPTLKENIVLIPGAVMQMQRPIFIPRLDTENADPVNPSEISVIDSKDIIINGVNWGPIEVTIPPGTAFQRETSSPFTGDMNITLVNNDRAPLPLPDEIIPILYFAFQPPTAVFNPPVPFSFPNIDGYSPGAVVDLFGLNQDTGEFEKIGTGTVSEDGARINSDGGVIRSGSWHAAAPPAVIIDPEGNAVVVDDPEWQQRQTGSSSVGLQNGALQIDYQLPGIRTMHETKHLTFFYNSNTANPRPVLNFDVANPLAGPVPDFITTRLNIGGIEQPEQFTRGGRDALPFGSTDPFRQAYQFDASTFETGLYDYGFRVACLFPTAQRVSDPVSGRIVIRNEINSPFGAGWTLSELRRLHLQDNGNVTMAWGDGSSFGFTGIFEGTGEFAGSLNIPLNSAINDLSVADLNDDGIQDLILSGVSNFQPDVVNVFLGLDDGSFDGPFQNGVNAGTADVIVDDFDEDGILDVMAVGTQLELLRGNGDGTFAERERIFEGANTRAAVQADLDDDGHLDIAITDRRDGTVTILLGVGDGTFIINPISFGVGSNPDFIEVGDFNSDNTLDLAVGNTSSRDVTILFNDGLATFLTTALLDIQGQPGDLNVSDINEDGSLDLIVSNQSTNTVTIVFGDGAGGFTLNQNVPVGNSPARLAIADLNGDSILDIAVANFGSNSISVLSGDGEGNFSVLNTLSASERPQHLAAVDINGDGLPELINADSSSRLITIFPNLGAGGLQDTPTFPSNSGTGFPIVADFNADGNLDVITLDGNTTNSTLLFGDGQGGVGQPFLIGGTGGFGAPNSVATDFNNDGFVDWARPSQASVVNIFINDGLGQFTRLSPSTQAGNGLDNLAAGDFNKDGNIDLAAVNTNDDDISILLGDGTGAFPTRFDLSVGNRPGSIVSADFDHDENLDLAVVSQSGVRETSILFGRGNGTFLQIVNVPVGQRGPRSLVAADFDGDNALDLAQANHDDDTVSVIFGNGNRGFSEAMHIAVDGDPQGLQAGDTNNDGFDDLIVTSQLHDNAQILLADNQRNFELAGRHTMSTNPDRIGAGDFNNDGVIDFAVANGNFVSLLLGVPGELQALKNEMLPRDKLVINSDGTFTQTDERGLFFEYDAAGFLIRVHTNNTMPEIRYSYNNAGLVERIAYPANQTFSFAYDNNKLSTLTDPAGRVSSFVIDSDNNLRAITGPDGAVNQYAYDAFHRMTQLNNPQGLEYAYSYSANGFLERVDLPNGETRQFDSSDQLGVPPRLLGADRDSALPIVMSENIHDQFTTGTGAQARFKTDSAGAATEIVDELGGVTLREFDPQGNVTRIARPNGTEAVLRYNSRGDIVHILEDDGSASNFEYDAHDNLIRILSAEGRVTELFYDDNHNPIAMANGISCVTREHDDRGLLVTLSDSMGLSHNFSYDENGNIAAYSDAEGHEVQFALDAAGNVVQATDAQGNSIQYAYDANNRMVRVTNELNVSHELTYDERGNTTSITDPSGGVLSIEYDNQSLMRAHIDPLGRRKEFSYDLMQLRETATQRTGESIQFEHNDTRELTAMELSDGNRIEIEYNEMGRPIVLQDSDSRIQMEYHPLGELMSITYGGEADEAVEPDATVSFVRDRDAMLIEYTDPSGMATSFTYTSRPAIDTLQADRLTMVFDVDAGDNWRGLEAGFVEGATTLMRRDYNLAALVTNVTNALGETVLSSYTIEYNDVGDKARIIDHTGEEHVYTYDAASQLIAVEHSRETPDELYQYDMRGNRTASHLDAGPYVYDAANRIVEDGRFTYEHDGEGSMTRKVSKVDGSQTVFRYDPLGLMTAIEKFDGSGSQTSAITYTYNGQGLRTSKNVDGVVTKYLWNLRSQLIAEYNGQDQLLASYTYGPGMQTLLSMKRGGAQYVYHRDHLESVIQITDADGQIVNEYQYDSYGNILSTNENVANPFLYTGGQFDPESGLYYLKKRYYDPALGRFLQEDPLYIASGYNFYLYVKNNPVCHSDPDGLFLVGGLAGAGINLAGQGVNYLTDDKNQQEFSWGSFAFDTGLGIVTCGAGSALQAAKAAKAAAASRFVIQGVRQPLSQRVAAGIFNTSRVGRGAVTTLTNPVGNAAIASFGKDLAVRGRIDGNTLRDFVLAGAFNKLGNGVSKDFDTISGDLAANGGLAVAEVLKNWNVAGNQVLNVDGFVIIK